MSYISKGSIECGVLYQFERYLNGTVGLPALPIIFSVALLGHLTCGVRYCRAASFLPGALVFFAVFSTIGHCINIGVHTVKSIAPIVLPVGAEVGCFIGGLVASALVLWRSPLRAPLVMTGAFAGAGTVFMIFMIAGAANKSIDYVLRNPRDVYPQYLRLGLGVLGLIVGGVAGFHVRARYIWFVAATIACSAFVSALAFSIGQFNGCRGLWQLSQCAESDVTAKYDEQGAAVATGVILLLVFFFMGAACQVYWVVIIQRRLLSGCKIDGTPFDAGLEPVPTTEEDAKAMDGGSKAPYGDTPKHNKSEPPAVDEPSIIAGVAGGNSIKSEEGPDNQKKKKKRFRFRVPCGSSSSGSSSEDESRDPHALPDDAGMKSPPPQIVFGGGGSHPHADSVGADAGFDIVVPRHCDVPPSASRHGAEGFSTYGGTSADGLVGALPPNTRAAVAPAGDDDEPVETDCFGRVKKKKTKQQNANPDGAPAPASRSPSRHVARPPALESGAAEHFSPVRVVASPAMAFGGGQGGRAAMVQFPQAEAMHSDPFGGSSTGAGGFYAVPQGMAVIATSATPLRPSPPHTARPGFPSATADVIAFGGSTFGGSVNVVPGTYGAVTVVAGPFAAGDADGNPLHVSPVTAAVQDTPFMASLASVP